MRLPLKGCFRLDFEGFGGSEQGGPQPQGDGYPPYNLERLPKTSDRPESLRLVFAVAGFAPHQLDVSVTDCHLVVSGEQKADGECRQFLYRGIAARRFQRAFLLADGLEVVGADLNDGLLTVELDRRDVSKITKTIKIEARDG